jgi:hypothetical protein
VEALREDGVLVDRPYNPVSFEISTDEKDLENPSSYPITVR